MMLKKKVEKGRPSGTIYVVLHEHLRGTTRKGRTKTFTVYGTTLDVLEDFLKTKIEERSEDMKLFKR